MAIFERLIVSVMITENHNVAIDDKSQLVNCINIYVNERCHYRIYTATFTIGFIC